MDIKEVEDLANLARIDLSDEEKQSFLADMGSILGYVKQITEVKVDEVNPEYQVYDVWREDVLEPREFSRDSIVAQFPSSQDGFLKVKKIL